MILSHGTSTYTEYKKEITRYHFFDDPFENGADAVFGIDVHLMKLVNFFKSAASGYGTEKRVLLCKIVLFLKVDGKQALFLKMLAKMVQFLRGGMLDKMVLFQKEKKA